MSYTTTALLTGVRRRGAFPDSAFTSSDILSEADHAMRTEVLPTILAARSDYFVTEKSIALVDGQTEYRLPERAILSTARDVYLRDGQGRSISLPQLSPTYGREWEGSDWGTPIGYYLRGEKLVLAGAIQAQGTSVIISYERRPGLLVATSDCVPIVSVDTANVQATGAQTRVYVTGAATLWRTELVDVVQGRPGFDWLAASAISVGASASAIAGFLEFSEAMPAVSAGDWICPATKSCVVQLPAECNDLLVSATTLKLLEADGDAAASAIARDNVERARMALETVMQPRHRHRGPALVNRWSPLRSKRMGWYR